MRWLTPLRRAYRRASLDSEHPLEKAAEVWAHDEREGAVLRRSNNVKMAGYRVHFSPSDGRVQTASLRRVEGEQAAGTGDGGQTLIEGAPASMGRETRVTEAGDYRFFAGWRSEPFFFDTQGAVNKFQLTGDDFFAR
jgi:hypothetical protein